jgi:hypothetical protein
VSELSDALLPFAPARARVHAERARGVLFPGGPERSDPPATSDSRSAAAEGPSADTVSSWGVQVWLEQRRALSLALFASFLVVAVSFAIFALRLGGTTTTSTLPANRSAAVAALDAFEPLPSRSTLAPVLVPSAPLVAPELPTVKREPEVKVAPSKIAAPPSAPSRVAKSLQMPDVRRLSGVHEGEPSGALSNFGGRK